MAKVTGQSVALWILIAVIAGIITYILYRHSKIKASVAILTPVLIFYLSFVLTITIIERVPIGTQRYNLELFWTIRHIIAGNTDLILEIFWNIVLFIPLGLLLSALLSGRAWISIPICMAASAAIEVTQLLTHRGLFEFDDIIYNSAGAVIGFSAYLFLKRIGGKSST